MSLSESDKVYRLEILRLVGSIPQNMTTSSLPERLVPGLERYLGDFQSLYTILESYYHFVPVRLYSIIETRLPQAKDAEWLGIPENMPIFYKDISPSNGKMSHESIDAAGRWVLPGLIDMHSDAIETEILPRANGGLFPIDIAIAELEKKLANHGIATVYHALGIAENVMKKQLRNQDMMRRIMETMRTVTGER